MESPDSELLVDVTSHNTTSNAILFGNMEATVHEDMDFGLNNLKETLVQDCKKVTTPDHEGNINCAMDIFAPDQSSVSSTNSRLSSSSTLGPPRHSISSEPKDTSDSDRVGHFKAKLGNNYMTLLNEHDQQDAMSITSGSSTGDGVNSFNHVLYSPKTSPARPPAPPRLSRTSSPHFPNSPIQFPSSKQKTSNNKQWTVFGEDKENKLPEPGRKQILPVRAPPAIPVRNSLRNKNIESQSSPQVLPQPPIPTPSPSADLLTMDMDDLEMHLSDAGSPVPQPVVVVKPAIPPRRNLFSTSSTVSGSDSHAGDSDHDLISLPQPEGHINLAHNMSSGSCSPIDSFRLLTSASKGTPAPPVPPRKDLTIPKPDIPVPPLPQTENFFAENSQPSSSQFASFSHLQDNTASSFSLDVTCSSPSWVAFEDTDAKTPLKTTLTPTDAISDFHEEEPDNEDHFNISEIEQTNEALSDADLLKEDEDSHWRKPSSSPDVRASASKKKGAGGIGYLCLENDDCDNLGSSDNIDGSTKSPPVTITLPENDLSPEKPQSQWATFQNEEDEEHQHNNITDNLVGNISNANSSPSFDINSSGLAGSLNDVDGDLEDDFAVNRLSTEMPDLKGFNRADKGSQNNLVDFSDDRGSAAASIGSRENPDDDDVETIFDLTAQGDSLKRKRPKGGVSVAVEEDMKDNTFEMKKSPTPIQCEKVSFHVGPAGMDDTVFEEEPNLFDFAKDVQSATTRSLSTPHSSHSSRPETPANSRLDSNASAGCSVSMAPTNPFWSPTSTSSTSQCSLVDSPFDNIIFKSPQHDDAKTSKISSTPVRINLTASPVTPSQLVRIPPPPLSLSRSSTRARRSSQAKERVRNLSQGSTSAKRIDFDNVSESSAKAGTLPSSRAETPIQNNIILSTTDSVTSGSGNTALHDDIFDPFSTQSNTESINPIPSFEIGKTDDLFSWMEEPQNEETDASNPNTKPDSELNLNVDDAQDITLVLDQLEVIPSNNIVQNNTNTNAHVHSVIENSLSPDPISAEDETEITDDSTNHLSGNPDPLEELKKVTSVESPLGIQIPKRVLLPEVEIIESKIFWDVYMRFPPTKRTMSNRKWVPIHVKLNCDQIDNPLVKLYYTSKAQDPFRTVSLASHQMQVSKPKLQAHYSDEGQILGKLHAVKLMVVHYKEKQTFSPRRSLTRNASGFKHACKGKQSIKFGFTVHDDVMSFCKATRDAMFNVHKRIPKSKEEEHNTTVKYHSRDELLIDVHDELQAIVQESGLMEACKVRVHFFASSFLSGDPKAKITINDRKMEGKEVVRREDIIPTSLDGWIDIRDPELHESCTQDSYEGGSNDVGTCSFYPPDACRFELMRFATSYAESELPVIVKSSITVKGARIQLRCILRMSGNHSANKDPLTQIACEDVMIRFPVPDEWGSFFRVDGRFRNHSVKAKRAAKQRRRPATEAGVTMEASVGIAKYERAYRAIVWRMPRLPEKNAVQNTPRVFTCRIELSSDRDLERLRTPEDNAETKGDGYRGGLDSKYRWCEVEYTMPGPTASNVCVRSVSLPNTDRAEKFVSYQSHYFYKVGVSVAAEPVGTTGEEDVGTKLCAVQ
uniref:uncharacterized protein LOC120326989 n=1 Tax=Styela clava TaxID=7725 RepID=UPI001939AC0A|nr:uncharacterized protein LOC120326989 [Styela clava]